MITLLEYFAGKPHTEDHETVATDLLDRVDRLAAECQGDADSGFTRPTCPNTGTEVSGSKGGSGDGGFRLESATTGRSHSSHKEARGVDQFDPRNKLDEWLDQFEDGRGGNSKLEEYGLYREAPDSTENWCHLTTRAPGSGHRTFNP